MCGENLVVFAVCTERIQRQAHHHNPGFIFGEKIEHRREESSIIHMGKCFPPFNITHTLITLALTLTLILAHTHTHTLTLTHLFNWLIREYRTQQDKRDFMLWDLFITGILMV